MRPFPDLEGLPRLADASWVPLNMTNEEITDLLARAHGLCSAALWTNTYPDNDIKVGGQEWMFNQQIVGDLYFFWRSTGTATYFLVFGTPSTMELLGREGQAILLKYDGNYIDVSGNLETEVNCLFAAGMELRASTDALAFAYQDVEP